MVPTSGGCGAAAEIWRAFEFPVVRFQVRVMMLICLIVESGKNHRLRRMTQWSRKRSDDEISETSASYASVHQERPILNQDEGYVHIHRCCSRSIIHICFRPYRCVSPWFVAIHYQFIFKRTRRRGRPRLEFGGDVRHVSSSHEKKCWHCFRCSRSTQLTCCFRW